MFHLTNTYHLHSKQPFRHLHFTSSNLVTMSPLIFLSPFPTWVVTNTTHNPPTSQSQLQMSQSKSGDLGCSHISQAGVLHKSALAAVLIKLLVR
jgi:hypothetical protein